jgi:hypothetical protein
MEADLAAEIAAGRTIKSFPVQTNKISILVFTLVDSRILASGILEV